MTYFIDKDGRYTGSRLDEGGKSVPSAPRDGRMLWKGGKWTETPVTLADKDKPEPLSDSERIAALETRVAAVEKG